MPHIVLGISGGIAAYKAAAVASQLTQQGYKVSTIMTESAQKFITPLTLQSLTNQPVATDLFAISDASEMRHIAWAEGADLVLVAPATAQQMAKLAHGLAEDLLSSLLLATRVPVVFAPAMNPQMYDHPAVRANRDILRARGVFFIPPGKGRMACGAEGEGRLAEPEVVVEYVNRILPRVPVRSSKEVQAAKDGDRRWGQRTVLVTAGPTAEPLDPMRYLTNRSSGKMGYAVAKAARKTGARVILVSGPVALSPPEGVQVVHAETASSMLAGVQKHWQDTDIAFFVAAVSDFRPQQWESEKKPKPAGEFFLPCALTEDIAAWAGSHRRAGQFLMGFSAETGDSMEASVQAKAIKKCERKGLDAIALNQIGLPHCGAGSDENRLVLLCPDGKTKVHWPADQKSRLAEKLIAWVEERLDHGGTHCGHSC